MPDQIIYRTEQQRALDFAYTVFAKECVGDERMHFGGPLFQQTLVQLWPQMMDGCQPVASPYIIRLVGQTGSGKTTQLLPAVLDGLAGTGNYVTVAVRKFFTYHPDYSQLLATYGPELIREKTNGFALLMLLYTMEHLLRQHYNILLDMTVLDAGFETYLYLLMREYGYRHNFNLLSVAKSLSDQWLLKRAQQSVGAEAKRQVPPATSQYFYQLLFEGLQCWRQLSARRELELEKYVLWGADSLQPLWQGDWLDETFQIVFQQAQQQSTVHYPEARLLQAKREFYAGYYSAVFPCSETRPQQ